MDISVTLNNGKTRMTTFIKENLKISYDQTNIVKHRVAANMYNRKYNIKINLPKNHFSKFMMIRELFRIKNVCKMSKIDMFKMELPRNFHCT